MQILESKSIYYDDVNLIGQYNDKISSRKEIPEEKWRIIVSPMPSVVGTKFSIEALNLNLSVALHRFGSIDDNLNTFNKIKNGLKHKESLNSLWGSIGLNDKDRFIALKKAGCKNFIIDVANSYLKTVVDGTRELYKELGILDWSSPENTMPYHIMVGNTHSRTGILLYDKFPYLNMRVGIGNGKQCETSTKATGYGRGQITELIDCVNASENVNTVADGGIASGACAAKAFGIGARYAMMGSYFGVAEEAQNVIDGEYKMWGCASTYNQAKFGDVRRHSEGKVTELNKSEIKPLKVLVDELWGGISSAVSYGGYSTLSGFIGNGVFEIKK